MEADKLRQEQQKQRALDEAKKKAAAALPPLDPVARLDHWLFPGIVVKIMNKKLAGGKFYKAKGTDKILFVFFLLEYFASVITRA
jgi:hypothetical protein